MQSNPYLAQHFGTLPFGQSGAAHPRDDDDDESMDAAEGFAHFTNPAHMKFSVFKSSKAATKEAPPRRTPDNTDFIPLHAVRPASPAFEFVPGQRRGILVDNFPSRPTTPRTTSSHLNNSALPPLMPAHASLTPRDAHAQRDEASTSASAAAHGGDAESSEDDDDHSLSPHSSPTRSPHSPYAHKAPPPATWRLDGSPVSQKPASAPAPAPSTTTMPAHTAEKAHTATISDLVQRSMAALRQAQAAMDGERGGAAGVSHAQSAVEVSPTTPSLSPPPPFPQAESTGDGPLHQAALRPVLSGDAQDGDDDMWRFISEHVPFISPISAYADEERHVFPHTAAPIASVSAPRRTQDPVQTVPTETSPHDTPTASQCLHAALLLDADAVVRRRLSRRPVAAASSIPTETAARPCAPRGTERAAPRVSSSSLWRSHSPPRQPPVVRTAPPPVPVKAGIDQPSPMTLDSLNSMITELGRFLHPDHAAPPFGPGTAAPTAAHRPRSSLAGGSAATDVHVAPAPTLLAGRHYPQPVVVPHGGDVAYRVHMGGPATEARHAEPRAQEWADLPSYAQPTQSWNHKRGHATDS